MKNRFILVALLTMLIMAVQAEKVFITDSQVDADLIVYVTDIRANADRVVYVTESAVTALTKNNWKYVTSKVDADIVVYFSRSNMFVTTIYFSDSPRAQIRLPRIRDEPKKFSS